MASPFPGMDPYLETPAFWNDFHASFLVYWSDMLNNDLLPTATKPASAKRPITRRSPRTSKEKRTSDTLKSSVARIAD